MSGGSYSYFCWKVEDFADNLRTTTPQRQAFQKLVRLVAEAAHDIEWVDSGDYGKGEEDKAIAACFSLSYPDALVKAGIATLQAAIDTAQTVREELEKQLPKETNTNGQNQ